jgi:fructokinase
MITEKTLTLAFVLSMETASRAWQMDRRSVNAGVNALADVIFLLSPQRIVLGGGVMERGQLFPIIRQKVRAILNGYIASPTVTGSLDEYIVPPGLGKRSAILGAMAMAKSIINSLPVF